MRVEQQKPSVRDPELTGRQSVGTDGRQVLLADLRGEVVLLDFWTSRNGGPTLPQGHRG